MTEEFKVDSGLNSSMDFASARSQANRKAVLALMDADSFALFWKDYLVEHPTFTFKDEKPKTAVKVSESSWQALKPESKQDRALKDFADWLARHGKALSQDTLVQEHGRLTAKLEEELARKQGGEDAAREAALSEDPQVKAALGVLKVAKVYQAKAR